MKRILKLFLLVVSFITLTACATTTIGIATNQNGVLPDIQCLQANTQICLEYVFSDRLLDAIAGKRD